MIIHGSKETEVHQEATILNVYAHLSTGISKHMKQKLTVELQGKIDKSTIIVRDFSTLPQ